MKPYRLKIVCALALACSGALAAGSVLADKPSWAGKGGKNEQRGEQHEGRSDAKGGHFEERQRVAVREYYAGEFRSGKCPPGLAKKQNGCMPPGQAKKWQVGRPLPREVVYYEVPQQVVVQIGLPPAGHRYVRVATDILMIAIGTGLVVDAINDLGR